MPERRRPRVGILISGRGSNMAALIRAMRDGAVPAEPAVGISNVPAAAGLSTAAAWGIATAIVDHKDVRPREAHELQMIEILETQQVDIVCLAVYMPRLSPLMVTRFRGRILNVH